MSSEVTPLIPALHFEGRVVNGTRTRVMAGRPDATEGMDDVVLSIDDRVQMLAEYRVVDVRFTVDDKTGQLIREQIVKPVQMMLTPWDSENPDDDGVIRAIQ